MSVNQFQDTPININLEEQVAQLKQQLAEKEAKIAELLEKVRKYEEDIKGADSWKNIATEAPKLAHPTKARASRRAPTSKTTSSSTTTSNDAELKENSTEKDSGDKEPETKEIPQQTESDIKKKVAGMGGIAMPLPVLNSLRKSGPLSSGPAEQADSKEQKKDLKEIKEETAATNRPSLRTSQPMEKKEEKKSEESEKKFASILKSTRERANSASKKDGPPAPPSLEDKPKPTTSNSSPLKKNENTDIPKEEVAPKPTLKPWQQKPATASAAPSNAPSTPITADTPKDETARPLKPWQQKPATAAPAPSNTPSTPITDSPATRPGTGTAKPLAAPSKPTGTSAQKPSIGSSGSLTSPAGDEKELREWIEKTIGDPVLANATDLKSGLHDGSVLCKLVNKLRKDGNTIKINAGKFSASHMENINNYLKCINEVFKIPVSQSFLATDLYDGSNMEKVYKNLQALKNIRK